MTSIDTKIERLEDAIASGARVVSYDDRRVEYRSLKEMKQVLAGLKAKRDGKKRKRRTNPGYDSGL